MELSEPITDFKQVTPDLLTDRLTRNGFLMAGSVTAVERTDSFGSSAAQWDRLKITTSDDYEGSVSEAIVLKVYRKGWFWGGVAEWTFYNELAPATPGVSVCPVYDCGIDRESQGCHYIMPDLSVSHTEPPKDNKDRPFEDVVRELVKYHAEWWNHPRLEEWPFQVSPGGPLRMAAAVKAEDIRESAEKFKRSLKEFVKSTDEEIDPRWIAITERVIERYPDVFIERISDSSSITMLHGDAHLWNYYYPKDPTTGSLILFDWETYKRGLAPYDLAYLLVHGTSGRRELEKHLMTFYYDELISAGVTGYGKDQFEYDFRLSVIACGFCPLIWKRMFSFRSAMEAYEDWDCRELLR